MRLTAKRGWHPARGAVEYCDPGRALAGGHPSIPWEETCDLSGHGIAAYILYKLGMLAQFNALILRHL